MKCKQIVTPMDLTKVKKTTKTKKNDDSHMGPDRLQGGVAMGWMPVAVAPKDYYYFYYYH